MLRKTICLFCVCMVLLTMCFVGIPAAADGSKLRSRKVVSVVYDDSGSMLNEKWEYTSYAMQCFAAMLNKGDRLDITYMSSYKKGSFAVDTSNRAQSVKDIREHSSSGSTPSEAIDTAFTTMQSVNDTDSNTQYWLIVMTDGQMSGNETAETKINRIADTSMPNGTKPHIVFLTICDTNNSFMPPFTKSNIEPKSALTADQIIDVISEIACDISGRYAVDEADIDVVDDTTVKVTSDIPLINMGILTQRSGATVTSITDKKGNSLTEECNVPVSAPGKHIKQIPPEEFAKLNGNVALFNSGSKNIAPGTYTITFSQKISKDDLVVMFEPAFELRLELYIGKKKITDYAKLAEGTKVDIEAVLYETGTDNRILASMLPNGAENKITLSEDGNEVISKDSLKLKDVTLKGLQTAVNASIKIPGYFTVRDSIVFTPEKIILSNVSANVHYDGSKRRTENGKKDAENVVYITDLAKNKTGVKFTLYIDDKPIDKTKALSVKDDFEKELNTDFGNLKVTVADDGSLIAYPTDSWIPSLIYWMLYSGNSTLTSNFGGITASGTICFKMGDWLSAVIEFIKLLAYIALAIYIIYWFIGKSHFRKNGSIKVFTAPAKSASYTQDFGKIKGIHWFASSGLLNFFGPRGMGKRVGPFYIRASKSGYTIENVKNKYVSTSHHYPCAMAGISQSKKKIHRFSSTVFIYDGTTYYKITIS